MAGFVPELKEAVIIYDVKEFYPRAGVCRFFASL